MERLSRNGRLLAREEWPAFRADGSYVRARRSFTVKLPVRPEMPVNNNPKGRADRRRMSGRML